MTISVWEWWGPVNLVRVNAASHIEWQTDMLVYSNLSIETHEAAFLSYSDMQVSIFNIPSLQPGPARWPRFLTRLISAHGIISGWEYWKAASGCEFPSPLRYCKKSRRSTSLQIFGSGLFQRTALRITRAEMIGLVNTRISAWADLDGFPGQVQAVIRLLNNILIKIWLVLLILVRVLEKY